MAILLFRFDILDMVMTKARIDNGEMEKKNVATTAGAADNCRSFLTFFTLL